MTTRRLVASEKLAKEDRGTDTPSVAPLAAPKVPTSVVMKLLFFTAAMIIAPLGSYFLTVNTIFRGNSTFAGATAAIVANVVLLSYVFVALNEESGEESKKGK